ncbi:MAG: response regulator transcription factor [Acidobacteria bacterium]|nr:response regulator transcription factor [Acidobacteriota bacterium]
MAIALRDGFTYEGYEVVVAHDGVAALRATEHAALDLVILDVMMPKLSGLDVCRRLREKGNSVPIIRLTARGQEIDKVVGLKLGADDYVTKPFSFMELLARVEAVLRRARGAVPGASGNGGIVAFGDVTVDFAHHEAHRSDCSLDLTPREFAMLDFFVKHRGEVVTREQLLDSVWGYTTIPFTRTVDTHVAKLRKKIEVNPDEPRHLVTVHRLGYKFVG